MPDIYVCPRVSYICLRASYVYSQVIDASASMVSLQGEL